MHETGSTTRVTRNVGWVMIGSIVGKIFFFAGGVITARFLGTEEYGIYSFATFFAFIFVTLADGGLHTILVRDVSRDISKAGQYFGTVLLMKGGMTLLALLILSCALVLMDISSTQVQAVYLAMAAYLALSFGITAIALFRAFERMVFEGVILALQGAVFLLLVIIGVAAHVDLLQIIGALLLSYVVTTLLAYYWVLTRFARPQFRLDLQLVWLLFREALPIGVAVLLFVSYGRIGTVALQTMRDSVAAGTYSAAFTLVYNLSFVPLALTAAILPTFSQSAVSHPRRFSRLYATAFKAMLLLGCPIAVGGMLLAEPIIRIVYGPEFSAASNTFRIIIWCVPLFFLSLVSKAALESANRQARWTWALAIGASANLLINILLIPHLGVIGASWALLLADVLILLVALGFVLRAWPGLAATLARLGFTTLGSAALMGLVLKLLEAQHLLLAVPAAVLVYLGSLALFRVVDREDLELLAGAFAAGRARPVKVGETDSQ